MGVDALRRGVFLDRDGVLNRALADRDGRPRPPASVRDVELLPGAHEACQRLHALGLVLVMVTNQPDIARGATTRTEVESINRVVATSLAIDDVRMCPHDDADGCECRKPKPGLLRAAAQDLGLDLARSYMVGDRWRDIEAGKQAGCRTVLVDNGWPEPLLSPPNYRVGSLLEAVRVIERG